jgi:hypothetical protein
MTVSMCPDSTCLAILSIRPNAEAQIGPDTDIFKVMHVAAVVHSILEAMASTEWRMQKAVQLLHQNDKN